MVASTENPNICHSLCVLNTGTLFMALNLICFFVLLYLWGVRSFDIFNSFLELLYQRLILKSNNITIDHILKRFWPPSFLLSLWCCVWLDSYKSSSSKRTQSLSFLSWTWKELGLFFLSRLCTNFGELLPWYMIIVYVLHSLFWAQAATYLLA